MKNPKTTILGILTIVSAVASALTQYIEHGTLDAQTLAMISTAVTTGIGLITASDASKKE